jgi:hypothetical protein
MYKNYKNYIHNKNCVGRPAALAAALCVSLAAAPEAGARERVVTTRIDLFAGREAGGPLDRVGFERSTIPGQPPLPRREVEVALHPDADLSTLEVELLPAPVDTVPGRHLLEPNPPLSLYDGRSVRPSFAGAGKIVDGRDVAAYGSSPFPKKLLERIRVSNRRGLLVLHLRFSPLRYRHSTGELLLVRHLAAKVRYRLAGSGRAFDPDPLLEPHLAKLENAAEARRWYLGTRLSGTSAVGYAIVVPDTISTKSRELSAFVAHKKSLGYKVYEVSDADLAAVSPRRAGDAEHLRTWLSENYKKLKLKYVLIIGNPDPNRRGVPMKETAVMEDNSSVGTTTPTDHYYADLTGTWDLDGDGNYAEYPDDDGTGGADMTPEVYVGRIPVYDNDTTALDSILEKTIAYEDATGDLSWRTKVLLPAAMLFFKNEYHQPQYRIDGATIAEAIVDQALKGSIFTYKTLFEQDGVDPSAEAGDLSLTRSNVIAEWKKGYGLVDWVGHGSDEGAYRLVWDEDKDGDNVPDYDEVESPAFFTYEDAYDLDDSKPSIVFHGSCSNGTPETPTNIAYGLLRKGAIATIAASRVAVVILGSTAAGQANIFGVERDFTQEIVKKKSVGEALFAAKEKLTNDFGAYSWYAKLEINLYGDPSITLASCATDSDCDDHLRCNGKEKCVDGQCVDGTAVTCYQADPCTEAACDEKTGGCTSTPRPDGEACDDGLFCTTDETCQDGVCTGSSVCETPQNGCVVATCDEASRTCRTDTAKHEGEVCRQGTDREGTCRVGVCEPEAPGCSVSGGGGPAGGVLLLLALLTTTLLARRGRRRGAR